MAKNFKKNDPNVRVRRPDPVYMRKHLPTFEEALTELKKAHVAFADILLEAETPHEAINAVVADFASYTPNILENENVYVSLDVTSNKLTYRVDKTSAFGWLITYKIENKKAVIEDVSAQVIIYNGDKNFITDLIDEGWEQVVRNNTK